MKKRILSVVLILLMVFSMIPAVSLTAYAATSAKNCTVRISRSLINKRCKQYATVKIKIYT